MSEFTAGPFNRAAELIADRVLVHASPPVAEDAAKLICEVPSGLVVAGAQPGRVVEKCRQAFGDKPILIDPAAYTKHRAGRNQVFWLPQGQLIGGTLQEQLDAQLRIGADVAMTPTCYIGPGAEGPAVLRTLAAAARDLPDDVVVSVPLDAAWLAPELLELALAALSEIRQVKAVMLGGQFNPPERVHHGVAAVRQLTGLPGTALFRTDLEGLDVVAHGALSASIGVSGTMRHIIPPGQRPLFGKPFGDERDESPNVLVNELVAFVRGSLIADRFGSTPSPPCWCACCQGRRIASFLQRADQRDAGLHGVAIWARGWLPHLVAPDRVGRLRYWKKLCRGGIAGHGQINKRISDRRRHFQPPAPLLVWAGERAE